MIEKIGVETHFVCKYYRVVNEAIRKSLFFTLKTVIILLILVAVFVRVFLVSVDWKAFGPTSPDQVDDLNIQEAHLDVSQSALFLITTDRWARLELKQTKDDIVIRWNDFIIGRPSAAQLTNTEPVSVMTRQDQITEMPEGFSAALFLGQMASEDLKTGPVSVMTPQGQINAIPEGFSATLHFGQPASDEDHVPVKSYVLVTTMLRPDGHHYVKFLYKAWAQIVSFHPPGITFFMYGPSYIALCIALPLAFTKVRLSICTVLFIVAFLLHGLSSLIIATLFGIGEATNGPHSDFPTSFLGLGWIALLVLWFVRFVYSPPVAGRVNSENSSI